MRLYLLALNPTDSVTEGFLPAAARLGLDVTVLTDQPAAHRDHPDIEILECDVRDFRAVITRIATHHRPDAVFTNSDHLQTQAALAAEYFGLPAKDWRAALRAKDKAHLRRHLALTGADTVWSAELPAGADPSVLAGLDVPFPCVVKPREGVASEDVVLAADSEELLLRCKEIQDRRPEAALVVEEFLAGELYTLETLGDGLVRHVLGGFHTELSPPPYFIEERLTFVPAHPEPVVEQILAQLDALGVGFGACHTEFVVHEGRARIIEVNYRAIGDQCDLLLAQLLDIPLFEHILRTHLGEPLPADLGARTDGAARLEYPCAEAAGTLVSAPGPVDLDVDGVRLTYRPLRETGERHELHHTNRDYLGVLRATGTDQSTVDRIAADFLAARRWEIAP
ncbi:ATP-grasp domain-containing protein [Streptomyces sp. NPDC054884]|uniref:ATP-grasp domain-containing protein n=1 Tax=Streptomyces sp. ME08-AFT2 TaxID=3028683 RepID=UPI0029AC6E91|nr:ATP-grasp domain-containing protein [Streptomyces sp. ME08-AFT2]MDX3311522.1 ATP-grasp domain-containing protein [Streptomyces sp. ME08-AFT2]